MSARVEDNVALLVQQLNGDAAFLGTIVTTTAGGTATSKNNHSTAVPFYNASATTLQDGTTPTLAGYTLALYSDVDCYYLTNTTNAASVTAANGRILVGLKEKAFTLSNSNGYLAILPVDPNAVATVKVWRLT